MKRLLVIILLSTVFISVAKSQSKADSYDYFIGINPIAPFTSLPNQFANLYLPLFSNLETGISINAGKKFKKSFIESRFSYGNPNKLNELSQIHLGYCRFINRKDKNTGLYIGGFTKYYHLNNIKKEIQHSSIIPYLCVGYRIERNFFLLIIG